MGSNYLITPDGNFVGEDELYHWGIKGMKWGIRRYQNPDGSLTSAGRRRYIGSDGNLTKAGKKYYAKETEHLKSEKKKLTAQKRTEAKLSKLELLRSENDSLKGKTGDKKNSAKNDTSKKSLKDMSDDEIRKAIDRKRLEDEYKRANPDPPSKSEKFNKFMDKLVNEAVIPATINAGKNALNKWAENILKTKVDPNSYEALKKQYDTLKIKKQIADLKAGKDPDAKEPTWDEKLKRQQYEANERDKNKQSKEAYEATQRSEKDTKAKPSSSEGSSGSGKSETGKSSSSSDSSSSSSSSSSSESSGTASSSSSKKKKKNKNKNNSSSETVYKTTVEGTGRNSWTDGSKSSNTSTNTSTGRTVVDARSDEPVTSMTTTRNTSTGRSTVSGYLNHPVVGLLPAPKDRDD